MSKRLKIALLKIIYHKREFLFDKTVNKSSLVVLKQNMENTYIFSARFLIISFQNCQLFMLRGQHKSLGSAFWREISRHGRVTVNTDTFFFGLIDIL